MTNKLNVLDYLVQEYKDELNKTIISYSDKEYFNISKARLHRLRLEINKLLMDIESECPDHFTKVNK